jgi:hypothetical protein
LSVLARLDPLSVEQLVIARAQQMEGSRTSIKQALESLQSLNQRFENTPEIIGLLAWTYHFSAFSSKENSNDLLQSAVKLAKQALALDPTNLDALKTLNYYHIADPGLREQAFSFTALILRHHPGQKSAYRTAMILMIKAKRPCEDIQTFVADIPTGVFTPHRLAVINTILKACLQSTPLEALMDVKANVSAGLINKAINKNLYLFAVRHDMIFNATQFLARQSSTQSRLNDYYWLTLLTGAFDATVSSEKLITDEGFWHWQMSFFDLLYGITPNFKASEHSSYTAMTKRTNTVHILAAALIIQSKQVHNPQILTDYLSTVDTFPISLINAQEAIALMMLQHHSSQVFQSQMTGKKLFDKLSIYYQENPHSFKFWGLGNYYLIAKFHCGASCQLPDDNQQGNQQAHQQDHQQGNQQDKFMTLFKSDHAFWMDDIAFTRVALSPWADDPVVIAYLAHIEQDRLRFREQRGL